VKRKARQPAPADKRSRLIAAAADLVHRQGFHATTLAHVADAARVPLGNIYYYFRTKEALGDALVDAQASDHKRIRGQWEATLAPAERLVAFVNKTAASAAELAERGCPMGSLCTELHKTPTPLAGHATTLLADWLAWLEAQFRSLGRGAESADLALHVMSVIQGASVLAHACHKPALLKKEAARLIAWIEEQTRGSAARPRSKRRAAR
jgi:TetR/AcrR family transcriptional regulator, transcriptional repressor for nem operon